MSLAMAVRARHNLSRPGASLYFTQGASEELAMLKNVLATVGLVVVVQKGFDLYRKYREMEEENEALKKAAAQERTAG